MNLRGLLWAIFQMIKYRYICLKQRITKTKKNPYHTQITGKGNTMTLEFSVEPMKITAIIPIEEEDLASAHRGDKNYTYPADIFGRDTRDYEYCKKFFDQGLQSLLNPKDTSILNLQPKVKLRVYKNREFCGDYSWGVSRQGSACEDKALWFNLDESNNEKVVL
jgi:hypothetical protein